jgi:nicotinamidase-related amidase
MDALDKSTTALVLIDLQEGILGFPATPIPAHDVKAAAIKLIAAARFVNAPIVFVRVGWSPTFADAPQQPVDKPMGGGALPDNWLEFPKEFEVGPNDVVITKRQWGAFYGTELDLQLRRRGITTIVLGGIATNIGVESTARDAWERNYQLVFASGAISGMDAAMHEFAMTSILPLIGRVREVDEIVAALK